MLRHPRHAFAVFAPALLSLAACKPDLGSDPSLVEGPRVLAIRLDPPEALPGTPVAAEVLAADFSGRIVSPPEAFLWALCLEPKPPAENNIVNVRCGDTSALAPLPQLGPAASITLPMQACSLHGPNRPPQSNGQMLRPRDPDVTGGYYQPIAFAFAPAGPLLAEAFALARIRCDLPNVSQETLLEFQTRYVPNTNPAIASFVIRPEEDSRVPVFDVPPVEALPGVPVPVRAGQKLILTVAWKEGSREAYPVYDPTSARLVDHTEELTVSWFGTGGVFERDRTGITESDVAVSVANTWTPPATAGDVHVWIVLRDSRGGLAFAEYVFNVS